MFQVCINAPYPSTKVAERKNKLEIRKSKIGNLETLGLAAVSEEFSIGGIFLNIQCNSVHS